MARTRHLPTCVLLAVLWSHAWAAQVQWDNGAESTKPTDAQMAQVADEIADVLIYAARITDVLGINIEQAIASKLEKNAEKYPVYQERLF